MIKHIFSKFLGISDLNSNGKTFILNSFFLYEIGFNFLFWLANTFLILHVLDYITIFELGFLVAIFFLVQALTDYPTGVFSDWIGQKWIMFIATILIGISYILFALSNTFFGFMISYIVYALAEGQRSGTYQTWFDNNYKLYIPNDINHQTYTNYQSKSQLTNNSITISSFILGGIIVLYFGRVNALFLQGILLSFYSLLFYIKMVDHPDLKRKYSYSFNQYRTLFKDGFSTTWENNSLRWVIFGTIFSLGAMAIWMNLILYPLYDGYSKSDEMIGVLRAGIYLTGSIILLLSSRLIKRISNTRNLLAFTSFISDVLFYLGIYVLIILNPIPLIFSFRSFGIVIMTFAILRIPRTFFNLLMPSFYLEAVPDTHRNSVYSLIPSLVLMTSVIFVGIGGILMSFFGLQVMLILLFGIAIIAGLFKARGILLLSPKIIVPLPIEEVIKIPKSINKPKPTNVG